MDRFAAYNGLLATSKYFKLVCGAGNEDCEEVRKLAFVYTLAGCNGFDVSANPNVVSSCKGGIEKALDFKKRYYASEKSKPFITVSVGMPGDHHVRKAYILDSCVKCNLCIPVCPTDAIPNSLIINEKLCIGCGNCEAVCPPAANAIRYRHNAKELSRILPECVIAGAESFELHAGVPDDSTTLDEWKVVCENMPNGMVSMCLDRYHMTNVHLIDRIRMAKNIAGDRLIIQADGIPMSGGTDDFNTTLQAVSIADIVNKELIKKDLRFRKLPILISGGTNTHTGELARQCGVSFSGITIGTHARKIVSNDLTAAFEGDEVALNNAVGAARELIVKNLGLQS